MSDHSLFKSINSLIRPPSSMVAAISTLFPIVLTQLLSRLFHVIDGRYANYFGQDLLLVHNVQFSFVLVSLFIGAAGSTSLLAFWKAPLSREKHDKLLGFHIAITATLVAFVSLIIIILRDEIIKYFSVSADFKGMANTYLQLTALNLVLMAVVAVLEAAMLGENKQKYTMCVAIVATLVNVGADWASATWIRENSIYYGFMGLAASTTVINASVIVFYLRFLRKKQKTVRLNFGIDGNIFRNWRNEMKIALIRAVSVLVGAAQLGAIISPSPFLTTYNLTLNIAYLACIPVLAGLPLALRDAVSQQDDQVDWWNNFLYVSLLPTTLLLLVFTSFPDLLMKWVYGFEVPEDHSIWIKIFFLACLIGQWGHSASIKVRATLNNQLLGRSFFFGEIVVMLGGTQILIMLEKARPDTVCWITLSYATAFCLLNVAFLICLVTRQPMAVKGVEL